MDVHVEQDSTESVVYDLPVHGLRRAMKLMEPIIAGRHTLPFYLGLRTARGRIFLQSRNNELQIDALVPSVEALYLWNPIILPLALRRVIQPRVPGVTLHLSKPRRDQMLAQIDDTFTAEIPIDQSPTIPRLTENWDGKRISRINREVLLQTLRTVVHAISTEETRFYLNGVFIHPMPSDDTGLSFVATDGHRLARRNVTGLTHDFASGIIIPRPAVSALLQLLSLPAGAEDNIDIHAVKDCAAFHGSNFHLATKLIDGTFPDYQRVIPADVPIAATFRADSLRSFCRRVASFGRESRYAGVELQMLPASKTMIVRWCSADTVVFRTSIDAACEMELSIGFQQRYLIQALNALKSETVTLYAANEHGPAIMASAGELADPSTTIVLMPMRI